MNGLIVKDLSHFYQDGHNKRFVLDNINYHFKPGYFYSIIGQSGSGKTTLLSLLAGLDRIQSGGIYLEGQNISRIDPQFYRSSKVGIVFQSYNLINYLSAVENVLLAMEISQNKLPLDHEKVAYSLLNYLGLDKNKADRIVNKLSGGEQQRVALARVLSMDANYILADEPTGNLDETSEKELIKMFQILAHKHKKCVIVVTHSSEVAKMADKVITLKKGGLFYE